MNMDNERAVQGIQAKTKSLDGEANDGYDRSTGVFLVAWARADELRQPFASPWRHRVPNNQTEAGQRAQKRGEQTVNPAARRVQQVKERRVVLNLQYA